MFDVVLFGGTDEGHKIADFLSEQKVSYIVCVATEYGAELLDMKNVRIGRMTSEQMADFFEFAVVRHRGKVLPGYIFKRKSEFTIYIDYTK